MIDRLQQLYKHRVLVEVLVQRELKARYRGTMLGLLWSFMSPLVLMAIYTLVFSVYMRVDLEAYPVYLMSGLLPWTWFVTSLNEGSNAIISNGGLIRKVYMPSEVFPLVSVLSNGIHFLFSVPILLGLALFFDVRLGWALTFVPVAFVLQLLFCYGVALITSSVAVRYRDLLHIIPNVTLVLFFLTPIMYPTSNIPERFRFLAEYNPLTHLMHLFQCAFYYGTFPAPQELATVTGLVLGTFLLGLLAFERRRELFAESV